MAFSLRSAVPFLGGGSVLKKFRKRQRAMPGMLVRKGRRFAQIILGVIALSLCVATILMLTGTGIPGRAWPPL